METHYLMIIIIASVLVVAMMVEGNVNNSRDISQKTMTQTIKLK